MSRITNLLLLASYAMVSVAIGVGTYRFVGGPLLLSWLCGMASFLLFGQAHSVISRARERVLLESELSQLRQAYQIVGEELERTRERVREMARISEARADERNTQIISEVRLLETLIQQMHNSLGAKGGEAAAESENGVVIDKIELAASATDHRVPDLESVIDQLSESELMDMVEGALNENRVDLYVQPIVSLPQRKIRYFEGLTRLRTVEGEIIRPSQYLHIAESTGLVSVIDNLLLFRCIQIVRQLVKRDKAFGMFCNISRHSLQDNAFFPQFLEFMRHNADLADYLIFEFGQDTVEQCGPMEKANMRRLAELGFRFSMDKVYDMDLNLGELRELNFQFVKVTPHLLLSALPERQGAAGEIELRPLGSEDASDLEAAQADGGVEVIDVLEDIEVLATSALDSVEPGEERHPESAFEPGAERPGEDRADLTPPPPNIHAADFKDLLNRYGIDLIVEKIETEREAIEVNELNVDFGQGYLFGEPRPAKDPYPEENAARERPAFAANAS